MANHLKALVSKKKLRYMEDGYNLDLSYISDRIIAMGFPAENLEALYRNSLDEVKKFLDEKHPDHYKIYNLCSEKIYDPRKFDGRVGHFPFDDHHPPTFSLIGPFCQDVQLWLSADPKNVAVVHCKAGKGRTGVMICCYFLHSGQIDDAQAVLTFYGSRRTADKKGVTIPSQRRYIHYYNKLITDKLIYQSVKLYLRCIVLDPVPCFTNIANDCFLTFVVFTPNRSTPYESRCYIMKRTDRQVRLEVEPPLLISDDVKIEFFTRPRLDYVGLHPKLWKKGSKEFHFWLNTFFVDADMNGGLAHDILAREHASLNSCESWSAPTTARVALDEESKHVRNFFLNHSRSTQDDDSHHQRGDEEEEEDELEDDIEEKFEPKFLRRLSQHAHCEVACTSDSSIDHHLIPPKQHQTVVGMSNIMGEDCSGAGLAELMRNNSFLLDERPKTSHQLQIQDHQETAHKSFKNGRILNITSSISNASSSSSSSSSLLTSFCSSSHTASVCPANSNSTVSLQSSDLSAKTTTTSFIEKRIRHASVPQTTSSMSHIVPPPAEKKTGHNSAPTASQTNVIPSARPVTIDGTNIALRLNKSQIDKAAKDKPCKVYSENFNVTIFLIKPTNQSNDLIDYSELGGQSSNASENFHHITVTPVMTSASTTSCNFACDEESIAARNSAKKFKKIESIKSRSNLIKLPKKPLTGASNEDSGVPVSPRAVTFAEVDRNSSQNILDDNTCADDMQKTTRLEDHELPQQQSSSQSAWI